MADPNPPAPAPADSSLGGRIVSGAVVISVVLITAVLLYSLSRFSAVEQSLGQLFGNDATRQVALTELHGLETNIVALFGAFTTLVGTAIAAYFGISAAGAASQHAVNAVTNSTQQLAQSQQTNADLQKQNASLQQQNTVVGLQAAQARDLLLRYDPGQPNHDLVDQARVLLESPANTQTLG